MHTVSRPIYVTRTDAGFKVTCRRGFVAAPVSREFATHAEANAFAMAKLRTKYYARSCVLDETTRAAPTH